MANEKPNFYHANASVPAALGYVNDTYTVNDGGFTTCTRNGVGDYSLTCNEAIDAADCIVKVTPRGAAMISGVVHTSDAVKQVLIVDNAGAASDTPFDVSVLKIRN